MTDEIQYRIIGNLGHITLNRPKALNALTYAMCEKITELLLEWQDNSEIGAVLIDGAPSINTAPISELSCHSSRSSVIFSHMAYVKAFNALGLFNVM